jgi:hypothetical protein
MKQMSNEEAEGWRLQALQLAATVRAVHENLPPTHGIAPTLKKALDKFNAFFQPIAERDINGQ